MSNVYKFERKDATWDRKYSAMTIMELLEEMVKYNEEREATGMNPALIVQGIVLFSYIETRCNTSELRTLASSFRRHLEHEKVSQASKNSSRD